MVYRHIPKVAERRARAVAAIRRGMENRAAEMPLQGRRAPDFAGQLRREVIIREYDTGEVVEHVLQLIGLRRFDQFKVLADGNLFAPRMSWSEVLRRLRKSYPRVPSRRSDFWLESTEP